MQLFRGRLQVQRLLKIVLIMILLIPVILLIPKYLRAPSIPPLLTGRAPDGNWSSSSWASSNNTLLGTAASTASNVWFTGSRGIVTTVFFPSVDTPNSTALEFLVGDSGHHWVDEEQADTEAQTQLANPHSLAWVTTNTARNRDKNHDKAYQIKKTIYTDPMRDALVQQVTFTALKGTLADYLLYVYYDPTIHNTGDKNSSFTQQYNNRTMLVSTDDSGDYASALAASLPYEEGMTSSGFVRFNDGLTDLKGNTNCGNDKCPDYTMNYGYNAALRGNTAQMGLLDLSNNGEKNLTTQSSITFTVVLAFGQNANRVSASTTAKQTLDATLSDSSDLLKMYISQWNSFDDSLKQPPAVGHTADIQRSRQQEYYLATNVLKASEDKQSGTFVAGLGIPWGEARGDEAVDGYHLVWQRDLYNIASALILAGDTTDPTRALLWSFDKQQQPDGHFPQNSDVSGTPRRTGIQMDQQAFPIMLAWKLGVTDTSDYTRHIKPAADYIVTHGPTTQQDRWGENSGYSPATLADEVAGLLCAANIAHSNGDSASEKIYISTADAYQQNIVKWTYTTTGKLGLGSYFLRIDNNGKPDDGSSLSLANGGGTYDKRAIVDMSFLELVRQGVLPANSQAITSSLDVVDATIRQNINGNSYWYRYNHDGYGEQNDGTAFDGSGRGRLWPLLSGERGIYTVAAGEDADASLTAMMAAANSSGMIPEQIWDNQAPAKRLVGTPTRSMNPLNWAMGEYITLLFSDSQHKVADIIPLVYERYVGHPPTEQSPQP